MKWWGKMRWGMNQWGTKQILAIRWWRGKNADGDEPAAENDLLA
jgi:hypothetical protein